MFKRDKMNCLRRFLIVEETWGHCNTPETNSRNSGLLQANRSRKGQGGSVGQQSFIHIDYLEKWKTMTGVYYAKPLKWFNAHLKQRWPHLAKKNQRQVFSRNGKTPWITLRISLWISSPNLRASRKRHSSEISRRTSKKWRIVGQTVQG